MRAAPMRPYSDAYGRQRDLWPTLLAARVNAVLVVVLVHILRLILRLLPLRPRRRLCSLRTNGFVLLGCIGGVGVVDGVVKAHPLARRVRLVEATHLRMHEQSKVGYMHLTFPCLCCGRL